MALRTLPVWTIPPNWSSPVVEGLEWLTSILMSVEAAEQRQQLRLSPRKSLEFIVQPTGRQRTYFDALLSTEFQTEFYLPLWYECGRMRRGVAPGETWLIIEGTRLELSEASVLFLQGPEPYIFELVEVDTVLVSGGKTTFGLASGFTKAWPKGTRVYPAKSAMLLDQPSFQRLTERTVQASLGFVFTETNDWDHDAGLDTYLTYPVVSFSINEGDPQAGGYARVLRDVDNRTGIPVRKDIAGIPFFKSTSAGFFSGRTDADQLRSLLYALKGKAAPAWFVSPNADFTLATPATAGAASLVVERSGFVDLGTPVAGREDIRILTRGGGTSFHRITGSALLSESHESLSISPVLPGGLSLGATKRISFMSLGRLDQDRVDLNHVTDSDGVCSFSIITKSVPDLRSAEDWDPPALPFPGTGGCGPTIPGLVWVRVGEEDWNFDPDADPNYGINGIDITTFSGAGPYFPMIAFSEQFIFGNQTTSVNFGGTPFIRKPVRARAYGETVTWNPADKAPDVNLNGGNLIADCNPFVAGAMARATLSTSSQSGLRYFEFVMTSLSGPFLSQELAVGFGTATTPLTNGGDFRGGQFSFVDRTIAFWKGVGSPVFTGTALDIGTVVGVAIFT